MTDKQPEALWMADCLDLDAQPVAWYREAAAELRRLHEVNAELLEALRPIAEQGAISAKIIANAKAVIAKVTGEQQ